MSNFDLIGLIGFKAIMFTSFHKFYRSAKRMPAKARSRHSGVGSGRAHWPAAQGAGLVTFDPTCTMKNHHGKKTSNKSIAPNEMILVFLKNEMILNPEFCAMIPVL
jgi:hypothetical protein